MADAQAVFPRLTQAAPFARVNPINAGTADEINTLLGAGAAVLMLPFFKLAAEVDTFVRIVNRRALTVGLVETVSALAIVGDITGPGRLDEVHFGFTDLGIELRKTPPQLLEDPQVCSAARVLNAKAVQFGIAGVARPGDKTLPYDPGEFAAGIARLGASRTIIARSFLRSREVSALPGDVAVLRAFLAAAGT